MPVCSNGSVMVDYTEDGTGETVVLIHSSVSGNRQWRALVDALKERFRVLAINLFGYGETTPWPGARLQTLSDQAELVLTLEVHSAGCRSKNGAPLCFVINVFMC